MLWRIAKHTALYRADDMSGEGAKLTGGRWNNKTDAVTYCSSTISLAALETLAHIDSDIAVRNRFLVAISVPETVWRKHEIITATDLEPGWLSEPPGMTSIEFGSVWLNGMSAALLLVPSIIVPEEYNVLINPKHPDSRKIKSRISRQFIYDPRL
jgi:RES domain-containing protein